ncbi:NAD(P)-binding domain-containing protein [Bacillus sp. T3]|uniref:NAD(P)-binding domain-containing protein n=1 Tax=Bacillus sp. T3 TaxID=467262 RepID=UPI0029817A2F|nr:NAD(P)-binding domain-containing protein [Bacillus sp. T3]
MKQLKIGLVGIGKLGTAMMTHWEKNNIKMGAYHPKMSKAQHFADEFSNSYCLSESELRRSDVLILALPATGVIPFISSLYSQTNPASAPLLINMATALDTKEIKAKFPILNVFGVKYMGHSRDLMEHGNGLFITDSPLPEQIAELYQCLGALKIDSEQALMDVNKLATYLAIKAAIEIEEEFTKRGFSSQYIKRALTSLAPEVIRGYSEGSLGHFAKEIVKEIKGEE